MGVSGIHPEPQRNLSRLFADRKTKGLYEGTGLEDKMIGWVRKLPAGDLQGQRQYCCVQCAAGCDVFFSPGMAQWDVIVLDWWQVLGRFPVHRGMGFNIVNLGLGDSDPLEFIRPSIQECTHSHSMEYKGRT